MATLRKARLAALVMVEEGFTKGEAFSLSASVNQADCVTLKLKRTGTPEVPPAAAEMVLTKKQSRDLRDFLNREITT